MVKTIKIIALDDEPLALNVIENYCDRIQNVELIQKFTQPKKFTQFLENEECHAVLMDIKMPKVSGIELYRSLEPAPPVIFTTSYNDYAISAFEINAVDYLLKPYSFERFEQAMARLTKMFDSEPRRIRVRMSHSDVFVQVDEVNYLEAYGDYVKIYLTDGSRIVSRTTFGDMLSLIEEDQFIRTHRSFAINARLIVRISPGEVELENGQVVPVGRKYKENLHDLM